MSDLEKPKRPKRPHPPPAPPPAKPKLELVRITPAQPPAPPTKPAESVPEAAAKPQEVEQATQPAEPVPKGLQPILPPTTPLQYRAVGLVEGRFVPEESDIGKGTLVTPDGQSLSCVVLGKMMSLIKKRLAPDRSYLWVVYPRTRNQDAELHLQIAGVWAPVELGKSETPIDPGFPEGQFSIRGEVVQVEPEQIVVKIKRSDAKAQINKALRKFKLKIAGTVPPEQKNYFWDMTVVREGKTLRFVEGKALEPIVQQKKIAKPKKKSRPRGKTPAPPKTAALDRPRLPRRPVRPAPPQ
ncbi:MAG: hypothetical protein RMK91_02295 [Pseudanabaenaceae cyanobacterium SKYGB_i_bin29]|nr:hypothetical protein [Pseudanabaenaceae cyanobacterium SKYG29]MDW8420676.1 hypothetical protein [Pseudanabaenaceae cyanobacterium SKYGB_i_bin29]